MSLILELKRFPFVNILCYKYSPDSVMLCAYIYRCDCIGTWYLGRPVSPLLPLPRGSPIILTFICRSKTSRKHQPWDNTRHPPEGLEGTLTYQDCEQSPDTSHGNVVGFVDQRLEMEAS